LTATGKWILKLQPVIVLMNSKIKQYQQRFDAQPIRERGLLALSLVVVISFIWWNYYAAPTIKKTELRQMENQRLDDEVENTRAIVSDIRQRIEAGVYQEKESQLARLDRELGEVENEVPGIYRHVLEIKFAGKYLDILRYMQTLESLDWKLLWDEIEIYSDEHPKATVKVAISTLSTRKEWVGI